MLIDLQLHSSYSDGKLSPQELAVFMAKNKVKIASLTDHNTIASLNEFKEACKKYKIKTVNGLELYCKYKKSRINILWYNYDEKSESLNKFLEETRKRRFSYVKKYLNKLKYSRDFNINVDAVLSHFDNYIPINRLTEKILENKKNYQKVLQEARKKNPDLKMLREEDAISVLFFAKNYDRLNESYVNIERVFKLREEVGGQLVFCHPGKYNKFANNMTLKLKNLGLDGIEVLSPHHSVGSVMYAQFLADELDLIATGGSDFHIFEYGHGNLNSYADWFFVDSAKLRRINEIINI